PEGDAVGRRQEGERTRAGREGICAPSNGERSGLLGPQAWCGEGPDEDRAENRLAEERAKGEDPAFPEVVGVRGVRHGSGAENNRERKMLPARNRHMDALREHGDGTDRGVEFGRSRSDLYTLRTVTCWPGHTV